MGDTMEPPRPQSRPGSPPARPGLYLGLAFRGVMRGIRMKGERIVELLREHYRILAAEYGVKVLLEAAAGGPGGA